MNGVVSIWNVREYAPKEEVPEFIYKRNHSREKITAWAGLCGNGTLLGPYIFDGNVNGYYYLKMINNFTFPQLQEHFNNQFDGVFQHLWWFQDRAPAHRLKVVRHKLHEVFANRVANHEVEWPPRSFDMTHCDFFSLELHEIASFCHPSTWYAESTKSNLGRIRKSEGKSISGTQCC